MDDEDYFSIEEGKANKNAFFLLDEDEEFIFSAADCEIVKKMQWV